MTLIRKGSLSEEIGLGSVQAAGIRFVCGCNPPKIVCCNVDVFCGCGN